MLGLGGHAADTQTCEKGQEEHLRWIIRIQRVDDLGLIETARSTSSQHLITGSDQNIGGWIMFDERSYDVEETFGFQTEPYRGRSP